MWNGQQMGLRTSVRDTRRGSGMKNRVSMKPPMLKAAVSQNLVLLPK